MKLFTVVAVGVLMFACEGFSNQTTEAKEAKPIPVCVYVGNGVKGIGPGRWLQLLSSTDGKIAVNPVDADDVLCKGSLDKFPLLVLPDGDVGEMASSLGERGRARIRAFIENGGACIASAAGARLLVQGGAGWGFVPWKVGVEPPRNPTQLSTTFTEAATNFWGMSKGGRRVWYNCGPVLEPGESVPAASFTVVAKFKGDINPLDPKVAPPMTGAPSLLFGTLGKGRVAVVADNPEYNAQTFDIVRAILRYTLGTEVEFNVARRKRGQSSTGFVCGDGWGLERARHYLKMLSDGKEDVELLDGGRIAEGLWMHLDQVVRDGLTGPARVYDRSMSSRSHALTNKGPKVKTAIYADRGVSCAEFWNVSKLISFSPLYEVTFVDHHDIANGVVNAMDFDLLLMSGGPIGVQESIVGAAGRAAVTNFVRQGGSYYGICAGTFSALQSVSPKHPRFALVPYKNMPGQPYRGWCNMNIRFSKDGAAALGVEPDSLRQVLYWGGPVMVPAEVPADSDIRPFAFYHGNVVNTFAGGSITPMAESVAVAGGRFGKGKVLCSAVHPECEEATRDIVKKYLKYLTGRPAEPVYTQHHNGALRVAFCMETATKAGMAFGMSLARDQRFDVRPVTPYEVNQGLLEHIDVLFFPWPEPRGYMSLVHDFIRKGGKVVELDPDKKGVVYKPGVLHVKDFDEARRAILDSTSTR